MSIKLNKENGLLHQISFSYLLSILWPKVISLLEMTNSCIQRDPEAAAFYYDELSFVVASGNLDNRIVVWHYSLDSMQITSLITKENSE